MDQTPLLLLKHFQLAASCSSNHSPLECSTPLVSGMDFSGVIRLSPGVYMCGVYLLEGAGFLKLAGEFNPSPANVTLHHGSDWLKSTSMG